MRLIVFSISCYSLLLALTFCVLGGDEEIQNLVVNPDFVNFEQGWKLVVHSGAAAWHVERKDGVGDDEECAFIEVTELPDPHWHIYLCQHNIPLEEGKKYTYSVWARTEKGKEKDIGLKVQRGTEPWTAYMQAKYFTINGEWKEYWAEWEQTETLGVGELLIFVESKQRVGKDKLWLDHIRVYEGDYRKDELSPKSVDPGDHIVTTWADLKIW